jgi:putative membrane protein insertion efficiency factor
MEKVRQIIQLILIGFIHIYRMFISPLLGERCRFYPSCSSYMKQAIQKYGPFRGIYVGFHRLIRCHPYSSGGVDLLSSSDCRKFYE